MSDSLALPFFKGVLPDGIPYGSFLIVEFEPQSLWYGASFTLVAQALKTGVKSDYHTFQRKPNQVKDGLARLGLDVSKLQEEDTLRIIDSYTAQTGIGVAEKPKGADAFKTGTLKLSDWSIAMAKQIKTGTEETEKRRLHLDDNTSVMMRYNTENEFIDYWRTRTIPAYKNRECILVNAFTTGVGSEAFYKQCESLCDGIIEFKTEEKENKLTQLVRVKTVHGVKYDSSWRQVMTLDTGDVGLIG